MEIRELAVADSYALDLTAHGDSRGRFTEWYRGDVLAGATGFGLSVAQANHSVSARGVLRGVHFALVPPGQAKYVYCTSGSVLDIVVDVRVGSPTFGVADSTVLDSGAPSAVYLAEGLGQDVGAVPLGEPAAGVAVRDQVQQVAVRDGEFADLHGRTL